MCDINIVHGHDEEETSPYKNREVKSGNAIVAVADVSWIIIPSCNVSIVHIYIYT